MKNKKQEIEDIAWQVFQRKLGLRFKRELTPEEKLGITDTPEYQYYREEAQKIWEKKQRALQNKKYPVIEIPSDGKRGWRGGAYCLCFVYSKYDGNFVLKGYYREVEAYLKKNYTHYFYNLSLWSEGFSRDIWHFWKKDVGIFRPVLRNKKKGKKIQVRPYWREGIDEKQFEELTFSFKRLPKRWIPEFDKL